MGILPCSFDPDIRLVFTWSLSKSVINLDFQMASYQADELAHKLFCRLGFNCMSFLYEQSKRKTIP